MYTYVATALIAAFIAATGAWKIQAWRFDSKEKERVEQQLQDQRAQASTAIRRIDNVSQAQSDAAKREVVLRRDADSARGELDGLRLSTDAAIRSASASKDAAIDRAIALGELLNQCGRSYQELGAVADRHVSDIKTLEAAWPK